MAALAPAGASLLAGAPEPARVVTLHSGAPPPSPVTRPLAAQAAGQAHCCGGTAAPGHQKPGGHRAPAALTEPAAQPHPGAAAQAPLQLALLNPLLLPYLPGGQGAATPPAHQLPTGHPALQLSVRTRFPPDSASASRLPLACMARPRGALKAAARAAPSSQAAAPEPARVVTTPLLAATRLMRWLTLSAT
jgi:hypothetical protein